MFYVWSQWALLSRGWETWGLNHGQERHLTTVWVWQVVLGDCCPKCKQLWPTNEKVLHEKAIIHSHVPKRAVGYCVLQCEGCNEVLHPEGLHQGLFVLNETTAYDHQLLYQLCMDTVETAGAPESAAYNQLRLLYERLGISTLDEGLPSQFEFKKVYRKFRALCVNGEMEEHTSPSGECLLFECPICKDPQTAPLIFDGTARESLCLAFQFFDSISLCSWNTSWHINISSNKKHSVRA